MARVVVSPNALADQDEILYYLAREAGFPTVEKYNSAFRALLLRLREFPGIGAIRPVLGEHTRIYTIAPYVIIYDGDQDSDTLVVHRVVHGHRDIQPNLIQR